MCTSTEYNITLRNPNYPVVNVGSRENPSYLPPEVCHVLDGSPFTKKLSPLQTANMIRFAVRPPNENAISITTAGATLIGASDGNQNDLLSDFGLSMTPKLITVPGRELAPPQVRYSGKVANVQFGSWSMHKNKFSRGSSLSSWTYVWIHITGTTGTYKNPQEFAPYLTRFVEMLKACGINTPNLSLPGDRLELNRSQDDEKRISEHFQKFSNTPYPPRLLLVLLPEPDTATYNRIKQIGDIRTGIHTVCVVASKFIKNTPNANAQYLANVALKFNLKLGGCNQSLDDARLGIIAEGRTMVVGLDVTHPSPNSAANAPSISGIVASIDKELSQFPAAVGINPPRKEMINGLSDLFMSRLNLWRKNNNGTLPENVLIYRDGVSESQYGQVLDQELPQIRDACQKTYPALSTKSGVPNITIIVVGKRHKTRFYPTTPDRADRSGNPRNGTVVDRGVTEAQHWDFFLQAHTAIQGTAKPAHYYVVLDEIFRNPKNERWVKAAEGMRTVADVLEDLTHSMCYMFGRATRAVSVAPPAYYADLVCERARRWLSRVMESSTVGSLMGVGGGQGSAGARQEEVMVHERLRDTMWYI